MVGAVNRCRHIPRILRHSRLCCQQINSSNDLHLTDYNVDDEDDDDDLMVVVVMMMVMFVVVVSDADCHYRNIMCHH